MCGRFALTDCEEKIIFTFGLDNSKVKICPRYNIYPSEEIPVIVQQGELPHQYPSLALDIFCNP